jgi:putative endonuclease
MIKTAQTGKNGEELARKYLEALGYEILETNWRFSYSEIDIICRKDNIIIFVEVKVRTNTDFGDPESFVDGHKMKKMGEAADEYIERHNWNGELRFDIIAIDRDNRITHFEDAFY